MAWCGGASTFEVGLEGSSTCGYGTIFAVYRRIKRVLIDSTAGKELQKVSIMRARQSVGWLSHSTTVSFAHATHGARFSTTINIFSNGPTQKHEHRLLSTAITPLWPLMIDES